MKNLIKSLVIIGIVMCLYSCNEKEAVNPLGANAEESFTLYAEYNDQQYIVPAQRNAEGDVTYLNEEFRDLFENEISLIPDLATFVYTGEDGKEWVKYYNSVEEMEKKNGMTYFNDQIVECDENGVPLTKGSVILPIAGRAILYDDKDFKDRTVALEIDFDRYITIPNLKNYANFNDKTSSIRVFNFINPNNYYRPSYYPAGTPSEKGSNLRTVLMAWENSDFGKRCFCCVATYSASSNLNDPSTATHQDRRLKDYGFNDKISSVVFRILNVSDIGPGKPVEPH